MARNKVKYYYNTTTLRYEKIEKTLGSRLLRSFAFICATFVFATIIVFVAYTYIDSPKEKQLKREISQMQFQYDLLNTKLDQLSGVLAGLQDRDDNIYRVIFEAEPIPKSIREAGMGGAERFKELDGYTNSNLLVETSKKVEKISKQMYIQSKSYDEVQDMISNKTEMLASLPAIQPVSNKDLTRLASGYGYRIDPIYKVRKMHHGIDFTAPTGTDIYSTGNGTISIVKKSRRGYGNHVIIDHGYGYKTLYAHLSKIDVRRGQKIKRGDIIGAVGSTGKSTAPHLHYEVLKDGVKINPINFFFNDLTSEEYDEILEIANRGNQSFD